MTLPSYNSTAHTRGEIFFMAENNTSSWKDKVVSPQNVLARIKPGMSIFLGTGVAEPRTLVKHLTTCDLANLTDLELIQLVSVGDAIAFGNTESAQKYRLKTFFAGWAASKAIIAGSVDMIPCRLSRIPKLFES